MTATPTTTLAPEASAQMDHRCDAFTIGGAYPLQRGLGARIRSKIDAHALRHRRRMRRVLPIEADEPIAFSELFDQRRSNVAAAPGNDDDFFGVIHRCSRRRAERRLLLLQVFD